MLNLPSEKVLRKIVERELKEPGQLKSRVALEFSHVLVVGAKIANCLTEDIAQKATEIILSCQKENGTFTSEAWDDSEMECAYSAVRSLKLCGTYDKLRLKDNLLEWILSMQNKDGGFGGCPDWYKRCTAQKEITKMKVRKDSGAHACFFAYGALDGLKATEKADLDALGKFLIETQRKDGSWGFHLDDPIGNTITTAMALHVLNKLDRLNEINKERVINWLVSQQLTDGGFSWLGKKSWVLSTARASKALRLLSALNKIDRRAFESYWHSYELKNSWDIICFSLAVGHPLAMEER